MANEGKLDSGDGSEVLSADELQNLNIDMFLDVNMTLSAEVGRTRIKLKDLLSLSKGSVVELNKLSGDPIDIMANGKLIAYGEVVSVGGKYGIRITSIASKRDRIKQFKDDY
ncbi:MAG: flagellar motor switch protein FliN [Legionellales bacterium]|nr:flagellar motor switch protein FliN [Legionellales bacterium]